MDGPDDEGLDFAALRYEPLASRPSKVCLADLGRPSGAGVSLTEWIDRLPAILGAGELKRLRDAIVRAVANTRPVIAALGGHVIKTGCAPYLIDWLRRGVLTGVALNGAAAIHDLELAVAGHTSEDVGPRLAAGTFGFARETSEIFAHACRLAAKRGGGMGAALAETVEQRGGPGLETSLLVAARRAGVPMSVHVALGTDIVHMFPELDWGALGAASEHDFRLVCEQVARLSGGVWLNLGSAVVLPEIFLKAVSIARNLGRSLDGLTTANLDFHQQYRGLLNVLQRPGAGGVALTGHHEVMIPLLHAAVVSRLAPADGRAHEKHAMPSAPHLAT